MKISDKQLQELIDNYHWIPPLDKIKQISKLENDSIALINEVIQKEEIKTQKSKPKCCEVSIRINPLSPRESDYVIPRNFISPLTPVIESFSVMGNCESILVDTQRNSMHAHARTYDHGFEYWMSGRIAQ